MASASRLKFLFVYSRHASAIAFRSESLSFFTTLSFSAMAVRMFTGAHGPARCPVAFGFEW